jgi:ATP-binding cassette subfamily B protein
MNLGLVVILAWGGARVAANQEELGTWVAFVRYHQKLSWPMMAPGMALGFFQRGKVAERRVVQVLSEKPEFPASEPVRAPVLCHGHVEFRNLSFGFPSAADATLKDISVVIEPGMRVAFLGAVGAGKSALLSLVPRLYPIGRGMLFIDGVDVNDWPIAELRRQIGFVTQDPVLFSGTVAENLYFNSEAVHLDGELAPWVPFSEFGERYGQALGERGVGRDRRRAWLGERTPRRDRGVGDRA